MEVSNKIIEKKLFLPVGGKGSDGAK